VVFPCQVPFYYFHCIYVRVWPTIPTSEAELQQGAVISKSHILHANFITSKYRSVLTDEHLTELVRTALTAYQPNFKKITACRNYVNQKIFESKPEHYKRDLARSAPVTLERGLRLKSFLLSPLVCTFLSRDSQRSSLC
jgi:hypothetical protein